MVNVGQYSSAQVSIWKQSGLIAAGCRGQEEPTEQTMHKLTNHCTPLLFAHKTKTQKLLRYGQKIIQLKRKLKETANPPINKLCFALNITPTDSPTAHPAEPEDMLNAVTLLSFLSTTDSAN